MLSQGRTARANSSTSRPGDSRAVRSTRSRAPRTESRRAAASTSPLIHVVIGIAPKSPVEERCDTPGVGCRVCERTARTPPFRGRRHRDLRLVDPTPPHPPDRPRHGHRRADRRPVEHARAVALAVAACRPRARCTGSPVGSCATPRRCARHSPSSPAVSTARCSPPTTPTSMRRSSSAPPGATSGRAPPRPTPVHVALVTPTRPRPAAVAPSRRHLHPIRRGARPAARRLAGRAGRRRSCTTCWPNTVSTPTSRWPPLRAPVAARTRAAARPSSA